MKVKILSFVLIALILSSFLILSVGAADAPSTLAINDLPIFEEGDPDFSGSYFPFTVNDSVAFGVHGAFQFNMSVTELNGYQINVDEIGAVFSTSYQSDSGITYNYYGFRFVFTYGFHIDELFDLPGSGGVSSEYVYLTFVIRTIGSSREGVICSIFATGDPLSDNPTLFHLYFNDSVQYPNEPLIYEDDAVIFFPKLLDPLNNNSARIFNETGSSSIGGYDNVQPVFAVFFSGPYDGTVLPSVGPFKPIIFTSDGEPDGGGGAYPGTPENPSSAFERFSDVIFTFLRGILEIEFFGGFFSLGDIMGIVAVLALLLFFVKWFAGG